MPEHEQQQLLAKLAAKLEAAGGSAEMVRVGRASRGKPSPSPAPFPSPHVRLAVRRVSRS